MENDRRAPSEEMLQKLARILGLNFDDMMARAGRVGERAERFLKQQPVAGVLFRRLADRKGRRAAGELRGQQEEEAEGAVSGRRATPPKGLFLPLDITETRMESELNRAGLTPTDAGLAVNVEAFIEKLLGARLDQHAELGSGVLGQTEFNVGAPPYVRIDRKLTKSAFDDVETPPAAAGARLLRTRPHTSCSTRAFFAGANLSLFEPAPTSMLHRCEAAGDGTCCETATCRVG